MSVKKNKILVVSCHPADAFDNAAGTIINHIKKGDEVTLLTLTHGVFSHAGIYTDLPKEKGVDTKKVIKLKKQETHKAAEICGIQKCIDFDYDDEPLMINRDIIFRIADIILEEKPNIIVSHHFRDFVHLDHAAAGEMTLRAINVAGRRKIGVKKLVAVKSIYMYGQQSQSIHAKLAYNRIASDIIINIAPVIELKRNALSSFKSQKYNTKYLDHRLGAIEGGRGFMHGYRYAEKFISLYPFKSEVLLDMQEVSVSSMIQDLYEND